MPQSAESKVKSTKSSKKVYKSHILTMWVGMERQRLP